MGYSSSDKSVYKQIALDIAQGIIAGRYPPGAKIKGRSTLAGRYNVSPETIRRAMAVLVKHDVLEVHPGAGIVIKSEEKAQEFVAQFQERTDFYNIRADMQRLMQEQQELNTQLMAQTQSLLDSADRFSNQNQLVIYEIDISQDCDKLDETIGDLKFWKNTYATIIAIRRGENIIPSPGPFASLHLGDTLLVVGDESSYRRANLFLYPEEESAINSAIDN